MRRENQGARISRRTRSPAPRCVRAVRNVQRRKVEAGAGRERRRAIGSNSGARLASVSFDLAAPVRSIRIIAHIADHATDKCGLLDLILADGRVFRDPHYISCDSADASRRCR